MVYIEEPSKRSWKTMTKAITYVIDRKGCHVCRSHKPGKEGYPMASRRNKTIRLHRFVYEKYNGPIPEDICVCHSCDNKLCINPKHLHLGTRTDNMNEAWERNRCKSHPQPRGELSTSSKLSEKDVRSILKSSLSNTELGRKFGVTRQAIYLIKRGRNWAHIK
jgi:hypothetical protein